MKAVVIATGTLLALLSARYVRVQLTLALLMALVAFSLEG